MSKPNDWPILFSYDTDYYKVTFQANKPITIYEITLNNGIQVLIEKPPRENYFVRLWKAIINA